MKNRNFFKIIFMALILLASTNVSAMAGDASGGGGGGGPQGGGDYGRGIDSEWLKTVSGIRVTVVDKNGVMVSERSIDYLTPESKSFWSNQQNLALVSQRLPIKNYRLKNLQDYFEKVFIPSRIGRVVDEIRYVSTTKVKAVQYTEQQDIIYYYFEKIDGRWFLHLDTTT